MYMVVLPACMSALCVCLLPMESMERALNLLELELQTVVTCWELNSSPFEGRQPVFLMNGLSPQPHPWIL